MIVIPFICKTCLDPPTCYFPSVYFSHTENQQFSSLNSTSPSNLEPVTCKMFSFTWLLFSVHHTKTRFSDRGSFPCYLQSYKFTREQDDTDFSSVFTLPCSVAQKQINNYHVPRRVTFQTRALNNGHGQTFPYFMESVIKRGSFSCYLPFLCT